MKKKLFSLKVAALTFFLVLSVLTVNIHASNIKDFMGSGVKSIQKGIITLSGVELTDTATINAVVVANSHIILNGTLINENTAPFASGLTSLVLTNTTTVTGYRSVQNNSVVTTIYFTVIEYY